MLSRRLRWWGCAVGCLGIALGRAAPPAHAAQGAAEPAPPGFRVPARRALPAVVAIRSATFQPTFAPFGPGRVLDRPSDSFMGRMPGPPGGSGFVIDAGRGLVLTNDHVLGDGSPIVVTLADGRERAVARVDRDPKSDLAVITLADPAGLVAAEWGDSDAAEVGDWVVAIGHPFGLSGTVTAGIIGGKGRGVGVALYEDLIQTDAAINPGNSGGPIVDLQGRVIGVATALKTAGGAFEGVGFAVPAARARRVAADLAAFGRVRRAYLGVSIHRVDPRAGERLGRGDLALISGVVADGPAAQAGLRAGDVIAALDGRPISWLGLQSAIEVAAVGEPLTLRVDRDGQTLELVARPAAQPDQFGLPGAPPAGPAPTTIRLGPAPGSIPNPAPAGGQADAAVDWPGLGLTVREPTPGTLVIGPVRDGGPADRAGVESGMRLTSVNGDRVEHLTDLRDRPAPAGSVRLGIVRDGKSGVRFLEGDDAPPPRP